jgi:hypothetical protein
MIESVISDTAGDSMVSRLRPARCKRRYREFVGGRARDQAGLPAVAQETTDKHNRIDLVLGEP